MTSNVDNADNNEQAIVTIDSTNNENIGQASRVEMPTIHSNDNLILECSGPEELTFKEIIQKLLLSINKKRILIPIPFALAKLSAKFFQLFPNPLLTEDQLRLLKYDNCLSGKYKNNHDLGFNNLKRFENEINKYSYNWKTGGQYSRDKDLERIK